MSLSISTLKVDVSVGMDYIWLQCKQYDHLSREYRVIFCDRGNPLIMTGQEAVSIHMWKDGETKPYVDKLLDWKDGYPVFTFTSSMLQYEGDISVDFKIVSPIDSSTISTRIFHITVQRSLIDYDGLINSDDYNILDQLIQEAIKVPVLITDFEKSQEQITELISKINVDITSYQRQYNLFNEQATELISSLRVFLSECQISETNRVNQEKIRVSNELNRQSTTAVTIKNCETAIKSINIAVENTNEAINYANTKGAYAEEQANRAEQALKDFDFRLKTIDGGILTDTTQVEELYDGGTL